MVSRRKTDWTTIAVCGGMLLLGVLCLLWALPQADAADRGVAMEYEEMLGSGEPDTGAADEHDGKAVLPSGRRG